MTFHRDLALWMAVSLGVALHPVVSLGAHLGVVPAPIPVQIAEVLGLKEGGGLLVADVVVGSPASRSGLNVGDIIVSMGRQAIVSAEGFTSRVHGYPIGQVVLLAVLRAGERLEVWVTLTGSPADPNLTVRQQSPADSTTDSRTLLDTSLLPEMTLSYEVTIAFLGKPQTMTSQVTREAELIMIKSDYVTADGDLFSTSTTVLRSGDLAPVSYETQTAGVETRIAFHGGVISGTAFGADGQRKKIHAETEATSLLAESLYYVIQCLPLTVGGEFRLPIVAASGDESNIIIEVLGKDVAALAAGEFPVLDVRVSVDGSPSAEPLFQMQVSEAEPHFLVSMGNEAFEQVLLKVPDVILPVVDSRRASLGQDGVARGDQSSTPSEGDGGAVAQNETRRLGPVTTPLESGELSVVELSGAPTWEQLASSSFPDQLLTLVYARPGGEGPPDTTLEVITPSSVATIASRPVAFGADRDQLQLTVAGHARRWWTLTGSGAEEEFGAFVRGDFAGQQAFQAFLSSLPGPLLPAIPAARNWIVDAGVDPLVPGGSIRRIICNPFAPGAPGEARSSEEWRFYLGPEETLNAYSFHDALDRVVYYTPLKWGQIVSEAAGLNAYIPLEITMEERASGVTKTRTSVLLGIPHLCLSAWVLDDVPPPMWFAFANIHEAAWAFRYVQAHGFPSPANAWSCPFHDARAERTRPGYDELYSGAAYARARRFVVEDGRLILRAETELEIDGRNDWPIRYEWRAPLNSTVRVRGEVVAQQRGEVRALDSDTVIRGGWARTLGRSDDFLDLFTPEGIIPRRIDPATTANWGHWDGLWMTLFDDEGVPLSAIRTGDEGAPLDILRNSEQGVTWEQVEKYTRKNGVRMPKRGKILVFIAHPDSMGGTLQYRSKIVEMEVADE